MIVGFEESDSTVVIQDSSDMGAGRSRRHRLRKTRMSSKSVEKWRDFYYGNRCGPILSRALAMTELIHSIRENVFTRRQYKDAVEGHLTHSFAAFFTIKLASLNGKPEHAERWLDEVEIGIEYLLPGWLLHPTRGFRDHRKAALEALETLKGDESHNRRTAAWWLKREYGLTRTRPLPRNAAEEYLVWVEAVIDGVFSQEEPRTARKVIR